MFGAYIVVAWRMMDCNPCVEGPDEHSRPALEDGRIVVVNLTRETLGCVRRACEEVVSARS